MAGVPLVTIAMVPRERFAMNLQSIASLYETTSMPFDFVCVDAGSPPEIRDGIAAEGRRRGFRVIRSESYLAPNRARNLAVASGPRTKYVVFVDNDVICAPGWLERLVGAAEETGADVCGPLICEGEPLHTRIHSATGMIGIVERGGRRYFHETNPLHKRLIPELGDTLQRERNGRFEFHCLLVRTDLLRRLGPLDEKLETSSEHCDLHLAVSRAGGTIVFEPSAVVTFPEEAPLAACDAAFFDHRWNIEATVRSEAHLRRKWQCVQDDFVVRYFVRKRRRWLWPHLKGLGRLRIAWEFSSFQLAKLAFAFRYRVLPLIGRGAGPASAEMA